MHSQNNIFHHIFYFHTQNQKYVNELIFLLFYLTCHDVQSNANAIVKSIED